MPFIFCQSLLSSFSPTGLPISISVLNINYEPQDSRFSLHKVEYVTVRNSLLFKRASTPTVASITPVPTLETLLVGETHLSLWNRPQ